ncbi:MAG TPA: hypothetical protein VHP38_09410 [Ruminiclostridium sp.]|nr:hypothetical protein [Ruminiclostridium sp.]
MRTGRQLYLLRIRDTSISDKQLSEFLNVSVSEILMYEYGLKPIPKDIYDKWERIICKI